MIYKVKWNQFKMIQNLELDFKKADGTIYNTIVIAGENGTGKTTILETLATFLNLQSIKPFEYLEYSVSGHNYRIEQNSNYSDLGFHKRIDLSNGNQEEIRSGLNNREELIKNDPKDIRYYGCSYSKARSGFQTGTVNSVTTQQLDMDKYELDNSDDFTKIKQMIIDIEQQDAMAWLEESKRGGIEDSQFEEFRNVRSKSSRFINSFNAFFDDIQYDKIDDSSTSKKDILFKKQGINISIDQLSTGEKQIVFRGAHLLRNMKNISGGVVFIDEPELSMHPLWQKKILNYYRGLFTVAGIQNVQMFFATHSEYVIKSALEDKDNVLVIILDNDNGIIRGHKITAPPNALPVITSAEINYLAFNLPSIDYHIQLYGYLQSKTQKHRISECDSFIATQPQYDPVKHEKIDFYNGQSFQTLPTYIRNAIDHPDSGRQYTEEELEESIRLLIELCK